VSGDEAWVVSPSEETQGAAGCCASLLVAALAAPPLALARPL